VTSAERGRLADLLDALGGGLLGVVSAARGLDVPVAEPVLYDPIGEPAVAVHDLLLAVGIDATAPSALDVVDLARRAGCCAIAIKLRGEAPGTLVHAAHAAGLALLAVPPDASWTQLLTLLRTARAALVPSGMAHDGLRVDDLFGLANAIAATLGGATTIEDLQSRVLAYSSLAQPIDTPRQETILGRQVPVPWSRVLDREGVFRQLFASTDVVRVPGGARAGDGGIDLRPRLAIAVRAGGEPLGSIWVIEGAQPFTAAAEDALRSAAQIAAMHLLHHRSRINLDRQRHGDSLRAVLDGSGLTGPAAAALRLPPGSVFNVLAFAMDLGRVDGGEAEVLVDRLIGLLRLHVEAYRGNAHVVDVDRTVYLLLASSAEPVRSRLCTLADEHRQRIETACKRAVRIGIGATVSDLASVPHSRREADQVLQVLHARKPGAAHVDDLRDAIALQRIGSLLVEDPTLREGKVAALAVFDRERGTKYVATLSAFLDSFGDVVTAARELHVHRNTFRYRLSRLAEIVSLDLADPDERLIAALQLRALAAGAGSSSRTKARRHNGRPAR
jgi:hypothetical protein